MFVDKLVVVLLAGLTLGLGACTEAESKGSGGGGSAIGATSASGSSSAALCGGIGCTKLTGSGTSTNDEFGWRVAIDGDVLVVGAFDVGGPGAAFVYRYDGSKWVEEQKLTDPAGDTDDHFGGAVDISGDLIVVGAYGVDRGSDAGAVFVYRYNGTDAWDLEQEIQSAIAFPEDHFGQSVSIDGDLIAVGASSSNNLVGNPEAGSVHLYRYNGTNTTWEIEQILFSTSVYYGPPGFDSTYAKEYYGWSVAVSGDVLIVGAPLDTYVANSKPGAGAVNIYRYNSIAARFQQERKLVAPGIPEATSYGGALALDGDVLIVGAFLHDGNAQDAGRAFVYRYATTPSPGWTAEQELDASDFAAQDRFGFSVDVDGDVAVVGTFPSGQGDANRGAAYVFRYNSLLSTWTQTAKLSANDASDGKLFGKSVSVDANRAVAGAEGDDSRGSNAGAAYVIDLL